MVMVPGPTVRVMGKAPISTLQRMLVRLGADCIRSRPKRGPEGTGNYLSCFTHDFKFKFVHTQIEGFIHYLKLPISQTLDFRRCIRVLS